MDAIYALPNGKDTLFFIEGTGQIGALGINWGDGFVTDASTIQQYGLSDPNSFFQTLLTKPYLNNVGISPHVYPPSVTFATSVRTVPCAEGRRSRECAPKGVEIGRAALRQSQSSRGLSNSNSV